MPITKSAKKALLVAGRRKTENDAVRARVKGAVKGAKISTKNNEADLATKLQAAYRELDLAAKKHIIHKNKAARLKSRLSLAAAKAGTETPKVAIKKSTKAATKRTTKKSK